MATPKFFQLPAQVRPLKYHLTLAPDLEHFTFRGEETVEIEVSEATSKVVVNSMELQVQAASGVRGGGTTVVGKQTVYDGKAETVAFECGRELPMGGG